MRDNKKPLPVCETGNGTGEQISLPDVLLSEENSTMSGKRAQGIFALLLCGEANAMPLAYLEKLTGLDRRDIRRRIQAERQAGACICVNNRDGYYLAETESERARCVRSMQHRAVEVMRTARAIERAEVANDEG